MLSTVTVVAPVDIQGGPAVRRDVLLHAPDPKEK